MLATAVKIRVAITDVAIVLTADDTITFTIFNNIGGGVIVGVNATLIAVGVLGGGVVFLDSVLELPATWQIYTDQKVPGIGSLGGTIGGVGATTSNVQLTLEYVATTSKD